MSAKRPKNGSGIIGNAISICGINISDEEIVDGKGLVYNSVIDEWKFVSLASASGLVFQGLWNASVNTPDLITSPPEAGKFWRVSVAGSTDLGGITDWGIGDWAVSTGSGNWVKVDNTDSVVSVNTQTGTVVLDADDIDDAETTNKANDANNVEFIGRFMFV